MAQPTTPLPATPPTVSPPPDRLQQQQTLTALQQQIRQVELGSRGWTLDAAAPPRGISSGLAAIDRLLPEGGYLPGTLIEWLVPGRGSRTAGFGAEWLALLLARRAMQDGRALVVVDPAGEFYPPAAKQAGIPLDRLVILRGQRQEDLYWSLDQALRCPGVAAVLAAATSACPRFLTELPERWHRRFQLSAEAGQTLGLFIRPCSVARQPSWSDIQWRLLPLSSQRWTTGAASELPPNYGRRSLALQLIKCRGGRTGATVHFYLDTRTGELHSARPNRTAEHANHTIRDRLTADGTRTSPPPWHSAPSSSQRAG